MPVDPTDDRGDETYFDKPKAHIESFDADLLQEPVGALPVRPALIFSASDTVTVAMRAMQREHRGCVVVTEVEDASSCSSAATDFSGCW